MSELALPQQVAALVVDPGKAAGDVVRFGAADQWRGAGGDKVAAIHARKRTHHAAQSIPRRSSGCSHGLAPTHRVMYTKTGARVIEKDDFLNGARVGFSVLGQLQIDFGLAMRLARQIEAKAVGLYFLRANECIDDRS